MTDVHNLYKDAGLHENMIGWIIGGIVVLVAIIFIVYYNRFKMLENRIDNSLSQIDVQLKKRADLVPNLIETVKGYAKHEKSIMTEVTKARAAVMGATTLEGRAKAGAKLGTAMGSLLAVAENYPQLKANENFVHLQQELSAIEDKVAYARQAYTDSILAYNNSVETFPGAFFAKLYGHKEKPAFQIPAEEKKVPKVSF